MRRLIPRRWGRVITCRTILLLFTLTFLAFFSFDKPDQLFVYPRGIFFTGKINARPPAYKSHFEQEQNLPQHSLDLPFPEGRQGRYVKFKNQVEKLGWNNVLNEV
jgi:hypothetical protein